LLALGYFALPPLSFFQPPPAASSPSHVSSSLGAKLLSSMAWTSSLPCCCSPYRDGEQPCTPCRQAVAPAGAPCSSFGERLQQGGLLPQRRLCSMASAPFFSLAEHLHGWRSPFLVPHGCSFRCLAPPRTAPATSPSWTAYPARPSPMQQHMSSPPSSPWKPKPLSAFSSPWAAKPNNGAQIFPVISHGRHPLFLLSCFPMAATGNSPMGDAPPCISPCFSPTRSLPWMK
jgi:hypothetical protein